MRPSGEENDKDPPLAAPVTAPAPFLGDLAMLPPPVSHLLGQDAGKRLSAKGKSILRALQAPIANEHSRRLSGREATLRVLTDNAYD